MCVFCVCVELPDFIIRILKGECESLLNSQLDYNSIFFLFLLIYTSKWQKQQRFAIATLQCVFYDSQSRCTIVTFRSTTDSTEKSENLRCFSCFVDNRPNFINFIWRKIPKFGFDCQTCRSNCSRHNIEVRHFIEIQRRSLFRPLKIKCEKWPSRITNTSMFQRK